MFINIFTARIKIFIREKNLIFWGLIFPIFLGTFLYLGTSKEAMQQNTIGTQHLISNNNITMVTTILTPHGELNGIVYFLGIIAIACIISGFSGCREMEDYLCYISPKAFRTHISPVHPMIFWGCGFCASWLLSNTYLLILCTYFKVILKIQLQGPLVGWIVSIGLGTLYGYLVGMFTGVASRSSIPVKAGRIAIFGVSSCILAGLINDRIKFYVDAYMPIISKINPASIIVDTMYTLCVYGMTEDFIKGALRLSIWNGICLLGVIFLIYRRRKV